MRISRELGYKRPIILYEVYNEPYHIMMGNLPYDFILFNGNNNKKWSNKLGKIPANHRIVNSLTPDIIPDIIINQDRRNTFGFYSKLAQTYNVPLLNIEFTLPSKNEAERYYGMAENCVYFSENHAQSWWAEKYKIIHPIAQKEFADNKTVFVNQSIDFLSFMDVINNMAAKKCVISTNSYENNTIIKHFYNGILFDIKNPKSLQEILLKIKNNNELVGSLGQNAYNTVSETFGIAQFVNSWSSLINEVLGLNENTTNNK